MTGSYYLCYMVGSRNKVRLFVLDDEELSNFVSESGMREVENPTVKDLIANLVSETLVRRGMPSGGSYLKERSNSDFSEIKAYANGKTYMVAVELL